MKIHASFECANGKNFRAIKPGHFQLEVRGDTRGYCASFALAIEGARKELKQKLVLDVLPDPDMRKDAHQGDANFFGNEPGVLWWRYYKPGEQWAGEGNPWYCLDNRFFTEAVFRITPDLYRIELDLKRFPFLAKGYQLILSSYPFIEYSAMQTFLGSIVTRHPDLARPSEIGVTAQGRKTNGLVITARGGRSKIPVGIISGQHPVEVSGVWATKGIIEYLVSSLPEADALRKRCVFHVFPQMNADGLAHGRPQQNSRDVNMAGCFEGAAEGKPLADAEAQRTWQYFRGIQPKLIFNFHGYYGPRNFGQAPYHGCYTIPLETVNDPSWRKRQTSLNEIMIYHTPALSQWPQLLALPAGHLECQLAKFCRTIGVCYEPNMVGGPLVSKKYGIDVFRTGLTAVIENPVAESGRKERCKSRRIF